MRNPLPQNGPQSIFAFLLRPLLRLFFTLLYHSFAWTYDAVSAFVSNGRWKSWIAQSTPFIQGPNVLELGHGPGHMQLQLAEDPNLKPFGLDESVQMGRQTYRRLQKTNHTPTLTRGLTQNLPYADECMSTVLATFPSEYILDPCTFTEIHRVLAPGGRLVILLASWITGRSLPDRFLAWLYRTTGQTLDPNVPLDLKSSPLDLAGFITRTEYVSLSGSALLFIIAEKAPFLP